MDVTLSHALCTVMHWCNTTDVRPLSYVNVLEVAHRREIPPAQTDGWNAVKTTEDDFISLPPKLLIWISEKNTKNTPPVRRKNEPRILRSRSAAASLRILPVSVESALFCVYKVGLTSGMWCVEEFNTVLQRATRLRRQTEGALEFGTVAPQAPRIHISSLVV